MAILAGSTALITGGSRGLGLVLARELVREDDPGTAALIRELAGVRRRGCFTRAEFLRMCRWKSPRAQHLWRANSAARIRAVSRAVLATRDERRRMELLTGLRGVGVPMASAILTLIDPRRYGVLDIRAWQLLFAIRSVAANRRGQGFTIAQWEQYLAALRQHARRLGVSARAVEYTLFEVHRKLQRGTLYVRPERDRHRGDIGGTFRGARRTATPRAGT
jgi:NAD(P)-dependent dehydrogenase (short-subunit alcohol dehydrogenase family)